MTAPRNVAASVHDKLLARAKREHRPFDEVLTYYGIERFLFRLGETPHVTRFVLKGALMLPLWGSKVVRATRDIDMLGATTMTQDEVARVIRDAMAVAVDPDGLDFLPDTIELTDIRAEEKYGGVRATFEARMDRAEIHVQLDVGFGDVITPGTLSIQYPTLLAGPAPRLSGYPPETAIAEKLEAIVDLGLANSRLKDYFDLWSLTGELALDGKTISAAVAATFRRRGTTLPSNLPAGLTDAFAKDQAKQRQWAAFVRRIRVENAPSLVEVVERTSMFFEPVLLALAARSILGTWAPGGPWTS
jgi:hypothetical protein